MFHLKLRSRATVVVATVAAFALIGTGTATARALITGADVKDGSLTGADIRGNSLTGFDIENHSLTTQDIRESTIRALQGQDGATGAAGAKGDAGAVGATGAKGDAGAVGATGAKGDSGAVGAFDVKGDAGAVGAVGVKGDAGAVGATGAKGDAGLAGAPGKNAVFVGSNWGVVHRNVIGNGDAELSSSTQTPPFGVGALNIRTGSSADKAAFGNEKDFLGHLVSSLTQVGFSVFTTGENSKAGNNMPAITIEIDPNMTASTSNFSSLVYVPANGAGSQWTSFDADADTENHWGLTGAQFSADKCSLNGTRCTLAEVQALLNDGGEAATVYSIAIGKGRDFAFSGAVDALVINNKTFDFEPLGVTAK